MTTHQDLFASACQMTDFETDKKISTGYDAWAVRYVRNGRHVDIDGLTSPSRKPPYLPSCCAAPLEAHGPTSPAITQPGTLTPHVRC